jgi:sugar/nucleoside kinase (ribokinase family)
MTGSGVDLRDVVTVNGKETPTVWIVSDQKHDQIAYVYQGPMARMEEFEPRTEAAMESDWVHIMTGRPDYYLKVMALCAKAGKQIGFDPAQEIHHVWDARRFKRAISKATAFFCNESELQAALKYLGLKRPEQLLEHVEIVVNTLGSRGSRILTREDTLTVPAVKPKKVVDTTGAGDAFRAGIYAGRFRGYDLRKSAIVGAAAASYVIEARGSLTNVPTWSQVEARARPLF